KVVTCFSPTQEPTLRWNSLRMLHRPFHQAWAPAGHVFTLSAKTKSSASMSGLQPIRLPTPFLSSYHATESLALQGLPNRNSQRRTLLRSPVSQRCQISNSDRCSASDERVPGEVDPRTRQHQNHREQSGDETYDRVALVRS